MAKAWLGRPRHWLILNTAAPVMTLKSSDRFTGIKPTAEEISQNNFTAELMWQMNLTIVISTS